MNFPDNIKYTKDHEWIRVENGEGFIGITEYAQGELGDIVFVELPKVGAQIQKGQSFGTVEAVKAVSDLYAPVSGTVKDVNKTISDSPDVVNKDPYGEGWMLKITVDNLQELDSLLGAESYKKLVAQ
ncbi:MAG: glycine cleavage system protein GcvH [Bacteroidota bacterium]|nr:glycine cleavage system protein GcvH [Bacteroidota bacterium]